MSLFRIIHLILEVVPKHKERSALMMFTIVVNLSYTNSDYGALNKLDKDQKTMDAYSSVTIVNQWKLHRDTHDEQR